MKNYSLQSFSIEVHEHAPVDFKAHVHTSVCYLEIGNKLLLLKRSFDKIDGGKWGAPGGKIEPHETPLQAAYRELREETGIEISSEKSIQALGCLYMRKPAIDYTFHMFKVSLSEMPQITLSDEHLEYVWVTLEEMKSLELMTGGYEALRIYYQRSLKKSRSGSNVNAYLILRQGDKVLLSLRKNTGYYDDFYGLVAGHVEDGESATAGMVREAYEEAGICVAEADLKVAYILHRNTNRQNVDVFFECHAWQGIITNKEPEKCGGLGFYALDQLPSNTIEYIVQAFDNISRGVNYAECGW